MAKPSRLTANYEKNVFINCPFDDEYKPLFYAIVFAVDKLPFSDFSWGVADWIGRNPIPSTSIGSK